MAELKPCPFCGGEAKHFTKPGRHPWTFIACQKCGAWSGNKPNKAEAVAAWNTRAERTCRWEYPQNVNGWVGYAVCSSCGEKYDETVIDSAHYCPNCGARVVSE